MVQKKYSEMTRGERVISFIETFCVVPEGMLMGQPVKLIQFQKDFILAIYDNKHITKTAILSIARKNAKTALIAFIVLAHLVGPEAVQNSRIISGAMSKEQAAEVFNLASKCVMLSVRLSAVVRIKTAAKILVGIRMNVEYKAISAEGKTAHGKSPILAILDEVGQVRGPRSDFIDAIITAQGAHKNALLIYISTQAANDSDFFSIIIDDALTNKPPKTICHVYAADEDAELMDEKQWRKANPALGIFRDEGDMRNQAENAVRMPSSENTFRNLNLNQRVEANSPFISKDSWKACGKPVDVQPEDCDELYGGLDLSGRTALTSFILYGLKGKYQYAWSYFWTPEKELLERSKADRTPYDVWVKQGLILTTPGRTVDYEFVASSLGDITQGLNIAAIAFDRWRMDVLKKEMERIGLDLPMVEWGQGFKDMAPALDAIDEKILNGTLRHGGNPVLTMCAANSIIIKDPAGNRKLDKMRTSGRIDGMQALAMAAGVAERNHELEGSFNDFITKPLIM